eukprot:gene6395-7129_t
MVANTYKNVDSSTNNNSQKEGHPVPPSRPQSSSSFTEADYIADLPFIRRALQSQGICEQATTTIMGSWRSSTKSHYKSYLTKWSEYCTKWKVDPISPPVAEGINFLSELFSTGLGYSSIYTARSAMTAIIQLPTRTSFGKHPLVCRFMKGVFNTRPALTKYTEIWDISTVLTYIKTLYPLEKICLKELTLKVVMLLAIISSQRCQTLHALQTQDMVVTDSKVVFIVKSLLKTSRPGQKETKIELQAYNGDKSLCPVQSIFEYLSRTEGTRTKHSQFFVSYVKPHNAVSKDTVARWLKMALAKAGIDTSVYKAHSTRAAASSAAKANEVSIRTIMDHAGWSSENTFMKFYNKKIVADDNRTENFGQTLLQNSGFVGDLEIHEV